MNSPTSPQKTFSLLTKLDYSFHEDLFDSERLENCKVFYLPSPPASHNANNIISQVLAKALDVTCTQIERSSMDFEFSVYDLPRISIEFYDKDKNLLCTLNLQDDVAISEYSRHDTFWEESELPEMFCNKDDFGHVFRDRLNHKTFFLITNFGVDFNKAVLGLFLRSPCDIQTSNLV